MEGDGPSNRNEDGRQSKTHLPIPCLSKSPSKPQEKSSFLRNNYNKYYKVSDFIKITTTSSAKPKNKKGLAPNEAPRYYEQMSLKHQVYLPSSGTTLTNQKSMSGKMGLALPSKVA